MYAPKTALIGFITFFIIVYPFGFWLSHSGKPHNSLLLTVHKLVALAALVFLVIAVTRAHQTAPLSAPELIAVIFAVLFFVIAGLSGGLVSTTAQMPAVVILLHKLSPHLTVLTSALSLFLLYNRY